MINIDGEALMTLKEATRHRVLVRNGRSARIATVHRWSQKGSRGVVLETVRTPSDLKTSAEAIRRFIERLTNPTLQPAEPTPSQQLRALLAAMDAVRESLTGPGCSTI